MKKEIIRLILFGVISSCITSLVMINLHKEPKYLVQYSNDKSRWVNAPVSPFEFELNGSYQEMSCSSQYFRMLRVQ